MKAQRKEFVIRGDTLKRAKSFKYLGRWMGKDDHDGRAVRAQLLKACKVWARLGNVLKGENVLLRVSGMFFKAVVQAVLLFRSKTWYLIPALLARLDGFQIKASYRMVCKIG